MARKKRKPLITSGASRPLTARDSKGVQSIFIVEGAYNELLLDEDSAQRINERGDELKARAGLLFRELSAAPPVVPPLLEKVSTTVIPANPEPFRARDHFVQNTKSDAVVKIAYIGENFRNICLPVEEPAIPELGCEISRLTRPSLDKPILDFLGEKATIPLAGFWGLLKAQGHGQPGALLANGWWNVAYIEINGVVFAVLARWRSVNDGWHVGARPVADPCEWDAGYRVISRNL